MIGQSSVSTDLEGLTRYPWMSTFLLSPLLRSWTAIWGAERQGGQKLSAARQRETTYAHELASNETKTRECSSRRMVIGLTCQKGISMLTTLLDGELGGLRGLMS